MWMMNFFNTRKKSDKLNVIILLSFILILVSWNIYESASVIAYNSEALKDENSVPVVVIEETTQFEEKKEDEKLVTLKDDDEVKRKEKAIMIVTTTTTTTNQTTKALEDDDNENNNTTTRKMDMDFSFHNLNQHDQQLSSSSSIAGNNTTSTAEMINQSHIVQHSEEKKIEIIIINTTNNNNNNNDTTTTTITTTSNDNKTTTKKGPAIAFLLSNETQDVNRILTTLRSLDLHMYYDNFSAPILIFNEGNLNPKQIQQITQNTLRQVHFPFVNFSQYPPGFDPNVESVKRRKRTKWGYQQMCRFWITRVWEHPILDDYSTFMRVDSDSCLVEDTDPNLPGMPNNNNYIYHSNNIVQEFYKFVDGLVNFTERYVASHNITPKNPDWWNSIVERWYTRVGKHARFMLVYNNFEVSSIQFFRQPHVMAYQRAVSDGEPFGVFRKRWGDAPVRTITLALFANESQVKGGFLNAQPIPGYRHPCSRDDVKQVNSDWKQQQQKEKK